MRSVRVVVAAFIFTLLAGVWPAAGQTLTFSLFERYLESMREQAAIPAISFAVIQDGSVWGRGLGKQDVEANVSATPDTPYRIGGLSQTLGAAALLRTCLEDNSLELTDNVARWVPEYPDSATTVGHLLAHATSTGQFVYDLNRFAGLTAVIAECADVPYERTVTDMLFEPSGMASSVPGGAFDAPSPAGPGFGGGTVDRFASLVQRTAPTYRLDRGRPVRTDVPLGRLSAADGVISTVMDLARFTLALQKGALLATRDVETSWTQARSQGSPLPTGLGWFVQNHNGEPLVWQFGQIKDGHSALLMNLPSRGLSFIALANSDGLTAPYNLHNGDATASPFAALFLRFFAP